MLVFWGSVSGKDGWRVKVGAKVIECATSAEALLTAQRMGFRQDRLRRTTFSDPAPPAPKATAPIGVSVAVDPKPPAPTPEPPAPDLSILDKSWRAAVKAIKAGEHDGALDALHAAESADRGRASVLAAIKSRQG